MKRQSEVQISRILCVVGITIFAAIYLLAYLFAKTNLELFTIIYWIIASPLMCVFLFGVYGKVKG